MNSTDVTIRTKRIIDERLKIARKAVEDQGLYESQNQRQIEPSILDNFIGTNFLIGTVVAVLFIGIALFALQLSHNKSRNNHEAQLISRSNTIKRTTAQEDS